MIGTDVVVLGAGPAGLGAAYRLATAGRRVVVLEREAHVGGLASSFELAGVRVDHGSHRLHPTTPAPILAVVRALLGDDLQRRTRHGRVRMAGRFVAFPPAPADLARNLPPSLSVRLGRDLATSRWRSPPDDSFASVVRASLGPTMFERFYGPYVEKLFGVPGDELAGELARRRIGAGSARSLLRRVWRPDPQRGVFLYPRCGYGQIPDAFARAARDAGADIRLGSRVIDVDAHANGVTVVLDGGEQVAADALWSTVPLGVLASLARAPTPVRAAATRLESRAMVLVYLVLAQDRWTEYDAHYFPERDVAVSRVSEPKNYRQSSDDPQGTTVLCAEIPCAHDDERWRAPADVLGAEVVAALERSGLPATRPVDVHVRRVAHAYPVYRQGFEAHFAVLDAWASAQPRVLTFGRQGLFAHDNAHHALAMAWAAADALGAGGQIDPDRWSAARAAFATHVVED